MDVDEFLRGHQPPAVSVDTESALAATLQRGRAHRRRRIAAAGALVVGLLVITGVAVFDTDSPTEIASIPGERTVPTTPEDGDAASWKVDPAAPPSADHDSFRALVTRIGCNGGRTGPVLRPGVVVHDDRIEVTFTVGHVDGPATCPGNLPEPYDVDLGIPLGNRRLVDGRCNKPYEAGDGGVVGQLCFDGGVKWSPPDPSTALATDSIVVLTTDGRIEEVGATGATRRLVADLDSMVDGLSVHPDRRRIFLGFRFPAAGSSNCEASVAELAVDGNVSEIGAGTSPAVSPDGSRLAYVALERRNDVCYRTAIVVRDLATERDERYPFSEPVPDSNPPELPLSWSQDGTKIAFVDQDGASLLDLTNSGSARFSSVTATEGRLLLPTFAPDGSLIALRDCCMAGSRLVRITLPTMATTSLALLGAPARSLIVGSGDSPTFVVLEEQGLAVIDEGKLRFLRDDVAYADG
jgi:hypothetical protein